MLTAKYHATKNASHVGAIHQYGQDLEKIYEPKDPVQRCYESHTSLIVRGWERVARSDNVADRSYWHLNDERW